MAGAFPDVPDYRMVTDIDGTRLRGIAADGISWQDFSAGALINVNDEDEGTFVDTATIADTSAYVFAFPQLRRVTGLFASFTPADQRGPTRTNVCANPSFEAGTAAWTPYNGTVALVTGVDPTSGTKTMRYTSTTAGAAGTHRVECFNFVPLTAAHNAVASGYLTNTGVSGRDFRMQAENFTAAGVSLGTFQYGTVVSVAAGATVRLSCSLINTGPTHTKSRVSLTCAWILDIGQTYEVDAVLIETDPSSGAPLEYFDGGSAHSLWVGRDNYSASVQTTSQVTNRVNLCINPSFETDLAGYVGYKGTLSRVIDPIAPRAGAFLRFTSTVADTAVIYPNIVIPAFYAAVPGQTYRISAWLRNSLAAKTTSIRTVFYKGASVIVSQTQSDVVLTAGTWAQLQHAFTIPAGVDGFRVYFQVTGGGMTIGATLDLDMILIEASTVFNNYFDGDSPSSSWIDASHASPSLLPAYNDLNWVEVSADVSEDTTNGVDGNWQRVIIRDRLYDGETYGQFAVATNPGYRSMILGGLNIPSVRALRLNITGATPASGWTFNTCHIYGDRAYNPELDSRYLVFYHPTLNQAIFPEGLDFGNVGDGDSQDRSFRLRNMSRVDEARDVVITFETLTDLTPSIQNTLLLSTDGRTFGTQLTLKSLLPGGVTEVMIMRKATPYTAVNGPWTARLHAVVGSWA